MSADPWEDLLQQDAPDPWETLLSGGQPQVGVTLEGLDAEAAAADQSRFKPWSQPGDAGSPTTTSGSNSAGQALWSGDALDSLADMGARASNSMYMGYGDELVGLVGGDDARDNVRNRMQLAQERSPGWSMAGDIAGGAVPAIATGTAAAGATRGLPLLERALGQGFAGAGEAALSASGYADGGDRMAAANEAAPLGFALGGAGEVAGTAVQGAGNWAKNTAAPWLREQGLMNRVASSGLYGGSMDRLAQNVGGKEGVAELGDWMENNGLTQWTPGGIGDEAQSLNSMWRGDQANFLDELAESGMPMVDTSAVGNSLRREAAGQTQLPGRDPASLASMYRSQADDIASKSQWQTGPGGIGQEVMPFDQALRARQAYDSSVNWDKLGGSREDALYEGVARDAANGLRGGLVESLENTSPELAPRWEGIQQNLSNSSKVMNAGLSRELRETGNQPLSLPSMIGAAGGGLPGMAAAAAVKTGGRAGLANVEGSLSRGLGGINPEASGAVVGMGGQLGAQQTGRDEGLKESRGYLLPQAAQQLMSEDPQALGPYQKQFFDTYQDPDGNALSNLITRLSHTDPRFKMTVLKRLQQMTAEGGY